MSLNILIPLSAQDYDSNLKAFIKSVEGQSLDVYLDTGGNPTIGWGFALNTNSVGLWRNADALNYFLHTILGLDPFSIDPFSRVVTESRFHSPLPVART